jgi:ketosteroid isomerase-like protein
MVELEAPIAAMIEATNREDSAAFLDAFSDDALINDWGREFRGKAEIATWNANENIGVNSRIEATGATRSGDETTVAVSVSGNGYNGGGSMVFTTHAGRIKRLVIVG